ncbi:alcohol oxidase [Mycena galopus ATCC 62051]|nr:alcohol oxidase [Mycena galopus ATCC 62051]
MTRLALPLILALATRLCEGVLVPNVAALNALKVKFDFIVVGGGTTGNVVANRLSEIAGNKVLLLEAGGSNAGVLDIIVPSFCPLATPNTAQDWNYTTVPQPGLGGRSIPYNRGFVLGGSSSVNYMVYTRGPSDDFDRWAEVTGDDGWTWNNLQSYIKKNEKWVAPADNHKTAGQYNPADHSTTGVNSVSLSGFPTPIDSRVIQTTSQLSGFPFNLDMNSGNPLGIGWGQATIANGARSSSATSYLAPQYMNRPNLYVLLDARVTRVLQTTPGVVRTVEFVQDLNGPKYTLTANKEVILSAGAIGTPNILMHSGIGDSTALTKLGITSVHNLPGVGQNLTDHSLLYLSFSVTGTNTFETAERNATLAAQEFAQWNATKTGPLVDNPLSQIGWLRLPSTTFNKTFPDVSSGPLAPHYELIFSNGLLGPPPPTGNYMSILPVVVSPASRGSITLNTNNALAAPVINPNLLGAPVDMVIMRAAARSAIRYTTAPAWNGYVIAPYLLSADPTDAELDAFIAANANTIYHPVGTAAMSPKGANWGVLNPDLSVKGLSGLRVADLSIVPFIPAGHPQAVAYIIGERVSDIIKAACP